MALAFPSSEFTQWLQTCTQTERLSIGSGVIPDLSRYGLPKKDPDLITLVQHHRLSGTSAIQVDVFIWPERITTGFGRTRKIWFGIVEVAAGPAVVVGRLLVAKAWTSDPGASLVAAEGELLAIAAREFP